MNSEMITTFLQIDGHKTVREIGEALEAKFGEKVQPLYLKDYRCLWPISS